MSAGLIETLGRERKYHFFDSFEGLPPAQEIDGSTALQWQNNTSSKLYFNNCSASEEQFMETVKRTGIEARNLNVYKGFFETTVPPSDTGPIALLRLDGDWYESTICCLRALFPRLVPGGLLIIDDYGVWDGCTRAVHDYLSAQSRPEPIERFGSTGVAFIRLREAKDKQG